MNCLFVLGQGWFRVVSLRGALSESVFRLRKRLIGSRCSVLLYDSLQGVERNRLCQQLDSTKLQKLERQTGGGPGCQYDRGNRSLHLQKDIFAVHPGQM